MLLYVVIFIVMVIKSLANSKSTMTDVDFLWSEFYCHYINSGSDLCQVVAALGIKISAAA